MSELLANESAKIRFTLQPGSGPPDAVYGGDIDITNLNVSTVFASKVKASGGKLSLTHVTASWTPTGCAYTSASHTFSGGNGTILPGSQKCRVDSVLVPMRENDEAVAGCIGLWFIPGTPPTNVPCNCRMYISDAGQTKAKGE